MLAAATANLTMSLDVDVMDVLFGFDGLAARLTQDGPQLGRGLFPLGSGETFGPDDELAFRRDGDDQLSHASSFQKRTRIVTEPSAPATRCTLAW